MNDVLSSTSLNLLVVFFFYFPLEISIRRSPVYLFGSELFGSIVEFFSVVVTFQVDRILCTSSKRKHAKNTKSGVNLTCFVICF